MAVVKAMFPSAWKCRLRLFTAVPNECSKCWVIWEQVVFFKNIPPAKAFRLLATALPHLGILTSNRG